VQNDWRSSLGGHATPACRLKQALTTCVHALELCPRCQSLAIEKRNGGPSPTNSSVMLASYASTHGCSSGESVCTIGP